MSSASLPRILQKYILQIRRELCLEHIIHKSISRIMKNHYQNEVYLCVDLVFCDQCWKNTGCVYDHPTNYIRFLCLNCVEKHGFADKNWLIDGNWYTSSPHFQLQSLIRNKKYWLKLHHKE